MVDGGWHRCEAKSASWVAKIVKALPFDEDCQVARRRDAAGCQSEHSSWAERHGTAGAAGGARRGRRHAKHESAMVVPPKLIDAL